MGSDPIDLSGYLGRPKRIHVIDNVLQSPEAIRHAMLRIISPCRDVEHDWAPEVQTLNGSQLTVSRMCTRCGVKNVLTATIVNPTTLENLRLTVTEIK